MCDKCAELDDKIAHYTRMSTYITDQLTLDGIKKLIVHANAERTALHPGQTLSSASEPLKSSG
jgi:hypothetical protein